MGELRSQHAGRPLRTFFAFDPGRVAILLIGGDEPPRSKLRGIRNLELFLDRRLVREEIYYTVWFNTKFL
jgi:hypothetical protein